MTPTTVQYHGVRFDLDVDAIKVAIVRAELAGGRTLAQVADAAGISRMSLWRLLDGQRVSLPTLHRVFTVLEELDPSQVLRNS